MFVGVCRIELSIDDNFSLKGKRSVIRKVIDRTRHRFHVSIAEVEDMDVLNRAVIGIAVLGNERGFVNGRLDKILDFIDSIGVAPIADHAMTIEQY